MWLSCLGATSARFLLVVVGVGARISQRLEFSNAFTRIAGIREAVALTQYGLSPYTGSAFRGAPLLLPLLAPSVKHPVWYCIPFLLSDLVSAACLWRLVGAATRRAHGRGQRDPGLLRNAESIVLLFLWNPLVVCTCIAGSSASFAASAVLLTLCSAASGAAITAGVGLAIASYLDLHNILLAVPVALIVYTGVEDLDAEPSQASVDAAYCNAADPGIKPVANSALSPAGTERSAWQVLVFCGSLFGAILTLCILSDVSLRGFTEHSCLGWLPQLSSLLQVVQRQALALFGFRLDGDAPERLQAAVNAVRQGLCSGLEGLLRVKFQGSVHDAAQPPSFYASSTAKSWVWEAYGGIITADDVTPNMGAWWYFVTEMFQEFKTFFKFVLHAQSLVFVVPLAIRLRHRPLFLAALQLMLNALLKPYPTASDVALYLTLLPLFAPQLRLMRGATYVAALLALLAVLGPAMWYQWIFTGSANANFFYAITIGWGAAQVVLIMMTLSATLRFDRLLTGKPLDYAAKKTA